MTPVGKNDMHPSFTETTRSIDNNTAVEKNDMHPPFLDTKRSIDNNTPVENNNIHLPFPDTKRCGKEKYARTFSRLSGRASETATVPIAAECSTSKVGPYAGNTPYIHIYIYIYIYAFVLYI